jgi:diguanylate cyclase (GGDEF)-like protein
MRVAYDTTKSGSILLVDDDPGTIQLLGGILADLGTLRFARNGKDALRIARESVPDLILLDAEMPGISGFQLLAMLRAEPHLLDVPVIFITGHTEAGFEVSALEMGAVDFIAKPFRASLVVARVKTQMRMKRMSDELRRAATTDALTGVANRRLFDETLEREWQRAQRASDAISLLLVDVDHFKRYNDRYGHPQGDECLRLVAHALVTACQRPADLVARYGGEEFMVLLPQTPRHGAAHVGRRVLDAVGALGIRHEDSATSHLVSVSVGIACHDDASPWWAGSPLRCTASNLILAADRALYSAKRAGRARSKLLDIAAVASPAGADSNPSSPAAFQPAWAAKTGDKIHG